MRTQIIRSLSIALTGIVISASLGVSQAVTPVPAVSAAPGQPANSNQLSQVQSQRKAAVNTSATNPSNYPVNFYNWSGYAATSNMPFVAVQSTYIQRPVTCTVPGAWSLFWVGFDGFTDGNVEQAGTAAQCDGGSNPTPIYYAWWEMYPTNTIQIMPLTIKPKDNIQAKATYDAKTNSYSLSVTDLTTKQSYTKVTTCAANVNCLRNSAEWVMERPTLNNAYTPLANWGVGKMTNNKAANTVNAKGVPVLRTTSGFYNTPINMINNAGTYNLATVGPLNNTGGAFSDTWLAAQ